jgi:hypothetical protein
MPFLSKYGVARHIYIAIPKAGSANHAVGADWTPAAGDVKISKDGGAAANVTNLPTAIAMGNSALWDFSLTATELQAAQIVVTVSDSATKAVDDTGFEVETYGNASAQHEADLDTPIASQASVNTIDDFLDTEVAAIKAVTDALPNAGALTSLATQASVNTIDDFLDTEVAAILAAVDTEVAAIKAVTDALPDAGALTSLATQASVNTIDDFLDTEIAAIKAKTDNLPTDPADASDIAASFTTVNTKLDTIDDFLDTEVAAIKAKTDNLPADPADASDIAATLATIAGYIDTEVATIIANLATVAGYLDTEIAAIKAKTDNLPAAPAATGDIPTVSQIWTTALTEAYRATGATGSGAQLLYEILQNLTEFAIATTTKTVKKLDGSTTAKTYTLNDPTTPTAITEAT